jgi:hypothetical protein
MVSVSTFLSSESLTCSFRATNGWLSSGQYIRELSSGCALMGYWSHRETNAHFESRGRPNRYEGRDQYLRLIAFSETSQDTRRGLPVCPNPCGIAVNTYVHEVRGVGQTATLFTVENISSSPAGCLALVRETAFAFAVPAIH